MFKLLTIVLSGLLGVGVLAMAQPLSDSEPDPQLIRLAVRATVHALPTSAPREVIVTEYVEVTRVVEVTREVIRAVTPTPDPSPSATATPEPSPTPPPTATAPPVSRADEPVAQAASVVAEVAPPSSASGCPATSDRQYTVVPVLGGPTDRPAHTHGDLNLALRDSRPTEAQLGLVDINGPTDGDAPQLNGIFGDQRLAQFVGAHQVFDWNWGCGADGCRGEPLGAPGVTLVDVGTTPGEALSVPRRNAEIYGGGFVALVLYAEENRMTLGYTREDSVANGYAVHLEGLCVDPSLVSTYRAANGQGRGQLPALRNGETLGTAAGASLQVAVRDRGMFRDPRSRKDWWAQY